MKKIFALCFALILVAAVKVSAQNYTTGIGAKFYSAYGSVGGINIKHSTNYNTALEGSLLFFSGGLGLEGLYEYQGNVNNAPGLGYFVGGGGLLGFGSGKHDGTSFALRLTGGLDYKIPDAPIAVSLGLDPFFNLAPSTGSYLALGIGLRYILK